MRISVRVGFVLALAMVVGGAAFAADSNPFLGRWALDLPGNGAGWLEITDQAGYLDGSVLWYGGSVVPVDSVYVDGDVLYVTRTRNVERKDAAGNVVRKQVFTELLQCKVSGDTLEGARVNPSNTGQGVEKTTFTGKRIPALPAKPDLAAVKFGKSIKLLKGGSLKGWKLTNPMSANGWSVKKGVLTNNPVQTEGQPHKHYGNLRTEKEFEDFNLKLEVNVPQGGNSGIYLRGIYEVQVADTYGQPLDPHNMGGIYSRITPKVAAEKKTGEWQSFDITLVDRHVTVKLNGQTIIDNEPLQGCTGGALSADEFKPGPLYLQGDHTGVQYRNIVLTPIVK